MRVQIIALLVLATLPLAQARLVRAPSRPPRPEPGEAGGPVHALSADEEEIFLRGRSLFTRSFHKSAGLGTPEMNADSCRACHRDPVLGGAGGLEFNVSRFANDNGGPGPFVDLPGGQGLSKLRPPYVAGREEYPATADVFEQRQTPSLLGGGLIEGIPDLAILANQDPNDQNGDGIRGVARKLVIAGTTEIGRFGWKAQVPTLADFVRDALGGELGLTSAADGRGFALASDGDPEVDPEIEDDAVADLAFFLSNLAPPRRTGSIDPAVLGGELLFERIGCVRCHVPELPGASGPVPLYSDLLLHDVMNGGFRGMSESQAGPGHFRTPPLWGIRATAPYLHDGRATTLRAAVRLHDGEARAVRDTFMALASTDQDALLAFLNDL